jgi:hypothetical protein
VEEIISRKGGVDPNSSERFEYITLDDYFPKAVLNNVERWKPYLLENVVTTSITNYLTGLE